MNDLLEFLHKNDSHASFQQEMRLLSLYGSPDGSLNFKVNSFSDGSGTRDQEVVFFSSRKEGLRYIQKRLSEIENYNSVHIQTAEEYRLKLDKEKELAYLKNQWGATQKNIDYSSEILERSLKEKEELKLKINKLEKK